MPHQTSYFSKSTIDWDANPDVRALYKKIISIRKSSEPLAQGVITTYADNDVSHSHGSSAAKRYLSLLTPGALAWPIPSPLFCTGQIGLTWLTPALFH
jgi:hypothetical protein